MELHEYIYVDKRRLDAYVEQIASPNTFDKASGIKIVIGWPPKVEFAQSSDIRAKTEAEKIKCLDDFIHEHNLVVNERPASWRGTDDESKLYRFETCVATKIWIPPADPEDLVPKDPNFDDVQFYSFQEREESSTERDMREGYSRWRKEAVSEVRQRLDGFSGLTIWYSERTGVEGLGSANFPLYLLLDIWKTDEPTAFTSAYSALAALFNEAQREFMDTVLHKVTGDDIRNPTSAIQTAFLHSPVEQLLSLGSRVIDTRRITTLYRVRRALPKTEGGYITLAYPIYIRSAGP